MKLFILAALALLVFSQPAGAFTTTQQAIFANRLCFVCREPAGGLTPAQRIDKVNERFAALVATENLAAANIHAVPVGPDIAIRVGHSLLVTVTPADARACAALPAALAARWVRNLKSALPEAVPPPRS